MQFYGRNVLRRSDDQHSTCRRLVNVHTDMKFCNVTHIARICPYLTEGFALALVAEGISSYLGPTLVGFLFDYFNTYLPGYSILTGLGLAATLLLLVTARPRYQLQQPAATHKQPDAA